MPDAKQVSDLVSALEELTRALAPQPWAFSLTDGLALTGAFVALGTFLVGLWQYQRAQGVERAKFAITAIDQFLADPKVHNATLMLDWSARDINLRPDAADGKLTEVRWETLAEALGTNYSKDFNDDQAAIRDTFDRFFYQLGRFEHLIQRRLISEYDVRPYLAYWCEALAGIKSFKNKSYVEAVQNYMRFYELHDSLALVRRFTDPKRVVKKWWRFLDRGRKDDTDRR